MSSPEAPDWAKAWIGKSIRFPLGDRDRDTPSFVSTYVANVTQSRDARLWIHPKLNGPGWEFNAEDQKLVRILVTDVARGWLECVEGDSNKLYFSWMAPCAVCDGTGIVDNERCDDPGGCYGTGEEFVCELNAPFLNLIRNIAVAALATGYFDLREENEKLQNAERLKKG